MTKEIIHEPQTVYIYSNEKKYKSAKAIEDIVEAIKKWRIWFALANQDIKLRYRRSALGPFWITISMAITVFAIGLLYGQLLHINLQRYFPFLTAGMLGWLLISLSIVEMVEGFTSTEGLILIKQIKLPYTLYIHRVILRNFIVFFHHILVFIPVIVIFHKLVRINLNTLLLIPGLIIIYINAFAYGGALALLGARYRDIQQIVRSFIQLVFFVTPVMWDPSVLPRHYQLITVYNPFYDVLELIRAPLLGEKCASIVYIIMGVITVVGGLLFWVIFKKYRGRVIYWL